MTVSGWLEFISVFVKYHGDSRPMIDGSTENVIFTALSPELLTDTEKYLLEEEGFYVIDDLYAYSVG